MLIKVFQTKKNKKRTKYKLKMAFEGGKERKTKHRKHLQ